jgi:hypothetical protein
MVVPTATLTPELARLTDCRGRVNPLLLAHAIAAMIEADRAQGSVGFRSRERRAPECAVSCVTFLNTLVTAVMVELKHIEKIPDGRTIERHVRIIVVGNRVRKIVPAAIGQRLQIPIPLDELQDRDVIGVGVADMAALRKARYNDERDAGAVAEEVERLDVSGVI